MKSKSLLVALLTALLLLCLGVVAVPTVLDLRDSAFDHSILWNIRMPKYGMAFLAGGCLALAGYLSQLLLNNPLADPFVLGVSGGAGVSVNLALYLGLPLVINGFFVPQLYAFIGCAVSSFLVFFVLFGKQTSLTRLLLVGMLINFMSSAVISALMYLSSDTEMIRDMSFWFMGSYSKASKGVFLFSMVVSAVFLVLTQWNQKSIFKLHVGLSRMDELGIKVSRTRLLVVFLLVVFTVLIVSVCGPIGFVGLVIPHFVRQCRLPQTSLFPFCFLIGGLSTFGAELLSTALFPQIGLPPGVVTAVIGIPVFLYLLFNNYRFSL